MEGVGETGIAVAGVGGVLRRGGYLLEGGASFPSRGVWSVCAEPLLKWGGGGGGRGGIGGLSPACVLSSTTGQVWVWVDVSALVGGRVSGADSSQPAPNLPRIPPKKSDLS